jgi:GntR family transcriptional regulator
MTPTRKEKKRPLYLAVRDGLLQRIQSGSWAPGQLIPSEGAIAREFGVSPGTARMGVAALATENVVVRHQGLGTFVYEHTSEDELSRFFCLFDAKRERISVSGRNSRPVRAAASRAECRELQVPKGSEVLRISWVRARSGSPFLLERISLPEALFPGLGEREKLPDTLYELYQRSYGVLVLKVEERLTAVAADGRAAKALGIVAGTPLLRIERVAMAWAGRPVEWRVSLCHLAGAHYLARLR